MARVSGGGQARKSRRSQRHADRPSVNNMGHVTGLLDLGGRSKVSLWVSLLRMICDERILAAVDSICTCRSINMGAGVVLRTAPCGR